MDKKQRYYGTVLWSIVIAYLTFSSGDSLPKIDLKIPHIDKIVHFGLFFIFSFFTLLESKSSKALTVATLTGLGYAGFIEIVQWLALPARSGDWFDFMADAAGLFLALLILPWGFKILKSISLFSRKTN